MTDKSKTFEQFLREQSPAGGYVVNPQIAYRTSYSQPKEIKWESGDREKYKTQYFTNIDTASAEGQAYKAGEQLLKAIQAKKQPEEIESFAREARIANQFAEVERDAKKEEKPISPAYWVTQSDFKQAFGRPYNAMSEQDRQDFFSLTKNAPGARRRTDVAGAGETIPSRQRPEFLPTFQDVGGVKVPETALGYTQKQQQTARLSGLGSAEEAQKLGGAYSEKPGFVTQREADKAVRLTPDLATIGVGKPSPKKSSTDLPYSQRQANPLEDPQKMLQFVQQYAPETLKPEQKRALGMEGEYRKDLPYARRAAGLEGAPLPPSAPLPPELLRAPSSETDKKPSGAPYFLRQSRRQAIEAAGRRQRESLEARGINVPGFDTAEKGFGQYNSIPAPFDKNLEQAAKTQAKQDASKVAGKAAAMKAEPISVEDTEKLQQVRIGTGVPEFKGYVVPESEAWNKLSDSEKTLMAAQALTRKETQKFFGGRQKEEGGFLGIGAKKVNRFSEDQRGQTPSETAYLNRVAKTLNQLLDKEDEDQRKTLSQQRGEIEAEAARRAKEVGGDIVNQTFLRQFERKTSPMPSVGAPKVNIQSPLPSQVKASIDRLSSKENQAEIDRDVTRAPEEKDKVLAPLVISPDSRRTVNTEFEKIFGIENRNLPLEVKQRMITQYKMQQLLGVKPTRSAQPQAKPGPEEIPQREGMRRKR